jgi:hypothetical protein
MVEHNWVLEHIPSYHMGGLEAAERAQLEDHIGGCTDCAMALAEARVLDETVSALFSDARPRPGMEDRMIRQLRMTPVRPDFFGSTAVRLVLAAAAVLLLGMVGAAASFVVDKGGLGFPGTARSGGKGSMANGLFGWMDQHDTVASEVVLGGVLDDSERMKDLGLATHNWHAEAGQLRYDLATSQTEGATRVIGGKYKTAGEMAEETKREAMDRFVDSNDGTPFARSKQSARRTGNKETFSIHGERAVEKNLEADEVSVPGPAKPNEAIGVQGEDKRTAGPRLPPVNMPAAPTSDTSGRGGETRDQTKGKDVEEALKKVDGDKGVNGDAGKERYYYSYRNTDPKATKTPDVTVLTITAGSPVPGNAKFENGKSPEGNVYFKPGEAKGPPPPEKSAERKPKSEEQEEEKEKVPAPKEKPASKSAEPKDDGVEPKKADPAPADPVPAVTQRKIIRSGDIEFEIDAFDTAVDKITKITIEEKGFVATVNSEKLPNGKVKGSVVVRCPPERLDTLILKLRALGDLKSQRIGSQDVTKQYTDTESELRANRAMESRLIEIIKRGGGGKDEIKDLLAAEKELGVVRTRIEKFEGELRYYNNLVSLSTLNIILNEREIRAATGVTETEKVDMGLEVEDVEKAQRDAHAAIADAKGRITKSELKQHAAGQYQCLILFETSPEAAGPLRDRLKQLGVLTRLDVGRVQQVESGSGRPVDTKVKREDVQFVVSLYNVANVAPRETVQLNLACADTEAAYRTVLARIGKSAGSRVVTHNLDRQRNEQIRGVVNFEVKTAEADAILADLKAQGEVMRLVVVENPDADNVTKSKRGFQLQLFAVTMVAPRETLTVQVASQDLPAAFRSLQDAVGTFKGRMLNAQLNEQNKQNVTADLDFEIPRAQVNDADKALASAGEILSRNVARAQDSDNVIDSKVRFRVTVRDFAAIQPRETTVIQLAAKDVPASFNALKDAVAAAKGRVINAQLNEQDRQNITAQLDFEVRRGDERKEEKAVLAALNNAGAVLSRNLIRAQDDNAIDTKVRLQLRLQSVTTVPPRETQKLGIEVGEVDKSAAALTKLITDNFGQSAVVDTRIAHSPNGIKTAMLVYDVPLDKVDKLLDQIKGIGTVRSQNSSRNMQVPEGELAVARIDLALSNVTPLVASDEGVWASMRTALSFSLKMLGWSLSWVLFGVMVLLPWAIVGYSIYRIVLRLRGRPAAGTPA